MFHFIELLTKGDNNIHYANGNYFISRVNESQDI